MQKKATHTSDTEVIVANLTDIDFDSLLTTREVATMLGKSHYTVASWRSLGKHLDYIKMGGSVRYRREDVDAYLAQCMVYVKVAD